MQSPYNLDIYQGTTFSSELTATGSSGTPINLTNYTIYCRLKNKYSDTTGILNLSGVVSNATGGYITLTATAAQTAGLSCNQYLYDIQAFTTNSGSALSLFWGYINVIPRVSF